MHPGVSSSVAVLTGVLTMSNMGAAISEVTNDALVAEAVKSKQGAGQGKHLAYLCVIPLKVVRWTKIVSTPKVCVRRTTYPLWF